VETISRAPRFFIPEQEEIMKSRGKILSALALLAPLALAGCSNPNGSPLVTTSAPPAAGYPQALPTAQSPTYGGRAVTGPSSMSGAGVLGAQRYR
jgi:hypothetical protein